MSFTSYQIWKAAYPELKAGELLKIQNVLHDYPSAPQQKSSSSHRHPNKLHFSPRQSNTAGTTSTFLESMTGNLNKNRIVHIEYVGITVADTPEFLWGTQPLQSKDVADTLTQIRVVTNPIEVDRWSYKNPCACS